MEKKKTRILVLIDVQKDFIDGALSNPDAQAAVPAIVRKVEAFDGDLVLATRDTHGPDYLSTREGLQLPVAHCIAGTPGHALDSRVQAALDRLRPGVQLKVVDKPTVGSLDLVAQLQAIPGELDVEICGFCTDICVVSNALLLKAALYDRADFCVDAACCAGVTPEKHAAALETMRSCQIAVR